MKNFLLITLLAGVLLAACGSDDSQGQSNPPTPTERPDPVDVPAVLEHAAELDGSTVEVHGAYWSDGNEQYLSHILMESYPPQIPKAASIRLDGEIPSAVLEQLHHSEPPFGQVTWGSVIVTGDVRLVDESGQVTLEVISIRAA